MSKRDFVRGSAKTQELPCMFVLIISLHKSRWPPEIESRTELKMSDNVIIILVYSK